jgi:plasmid maintenance system antidote protein VapI
MVAELPDDDEALAQAVLIAVRAEPDEWTIADLAQDLGVDFERVRALVVGPLEHQVSLSRMRRLRPR